MSTLRAVVIGAGNMGRHHVRILSSMRHVDLVGVVDRDAAAAASYAERFRIRAYGNLDELPDVDVAVVAVPTNDHVVVALAMMARGASVLVEKPLASSPEGAKVLVDEAHSRGLVLATGHVERFNPVVAVLARTVTQPRLIQFERLSPYTPRIKESVVFDLMVHDLDLACLLAGGYPVRVQASGCRVFSDTFDVASAILEFPSGCVASLLASRATHDKIRRIAVSEPDRFLVADTMRQDISIKREAHVEFSDDEGALYRQANLVEVPYLQRRGEPLALELEDFVEAVREGRKPAVPGEAGLAAVTLARAVEAVAGGGSNMPGGGLI